MTARRAVFHSSPRMHPYLRPAHSRPSCLFYATPPRTPHSCILSVPRRAMYSPAAPHARSNNHPAHRHTPPETTTTCLPPPTPPAAPHHTSAHPSRPPHQLVHSALPRRTATPIPSFLYDTAPPPKQPPDTARNTYKPPAHTSPQRPAHKKPQRPTPVRVGLCGYRVADGGKNSPPIPLVMRSCS